MVREFIICGVFRNLIRYYARRVISGRERLKRIHGPVLFVANHSSHVDTPLLLGTLPFGWRQRTAVVAAADYFYWSRVLAATVSLSFATVPLDRRSGRGSTRSTASLEPLVDKGWSLVMFAEGTRSRDGHVGQLRVGAATLAAEHGLPIVPVHVEGTHSAMPVGRKWMVRPEGRRFGRRTIGITFGEPIQVGPDDDPFEVMERVRLFMASCGAETTADPKLAERRAVAALAAGAEPAGAGAAGAAGASGSARPS